MDIRTARQSPILKLPYEILHAIFFADASIPRTCLCVCFLFYEILAPIVFRDITVYYCKGRAPPRLARYVRSMRHCVDVPKAMMMNMDNASFISPFEFSQLPNLTSYTLCVPHCRDEYFVTKDFLSIALHQSSLVSLSKLAEVYLDFCLNMTHLPAILGFLTAIPNLRRVGFGEPNGAFLVGVAAGLRNMHSIRELHISDTSAVTVTELHSAHPYLRNITRLRFGHGYKLSPRALLKFLQALSQLEDLQVVYQESQPKLNSESTISSWDFSPYGSGLPNLRVLSVHNSSPPSPFFLPWLRALCHHSPLWSLELDSLFPVSYPWHALLGFIREIRTLKRVVDEHVYVPPEHIDTLLKETEVREARFCDRPD